MSGGRSRRSEKAVWHEIRGLEQNPDAVGATALSGKKVMQFLSEGRYVANVVDGKLTLYGR